MPSQKMVNHDFLRDVFSDKKSLMKNMDVRKIVVPRYDEISVA